LSGDIELNPGPSEYLVLTQRLSELGLRPLDVGGDGDCFFKAVSHQLFGSPNSHLAIRHAGIQYLRNSPEQFIESNVANSWLEYLNRMSRQGTWCDALIVQAVANSLNIRLHITESHNNFTEPAVCLQGEPRTIYLGHVNEIHYVSTVSDSSVIFRTTTANTCSSRTQVVNNNIGKSTFASDKKNPYMRTYMAKRRANEDSACRQERLRKQRRYVQQQRAAEKKCSAEQSTQSKNEIQQTIPDNNHREERLGHVNEIHYVSTVPDSSVIFRTTTANTCSSRTHAVNNNIGKSTSASNEKNPYMRTYMAKRRANEDSECRQERLRKQRRYAQQQRATQKKCSEEQPTQSKNETQQTVPDNNHHREERLDEDQQYQKSIENLISNVPLHCFNWSFMYLWLL